MSEKNEQATWGYRCLLVGIVVLTLAFGPLFLLYAATNKDLHDFAVRNPGTTIICLLVWVTVMGTLNRSKGWAKEWEKNRKKKAKAS